MRRRLRNQLMLDLDCGGGRRPAVPAPGSRAARLVAAVCLPYRRHVLH
jgi:hypothetical protein